MPPCMHAQAMSDQGSGGAYEISQRMTAMMGWGATSKFSEDWVWNQAADTYALDPDMAAKLRKNNPQVMLPCMRTCMCACSVPADWGCWSAAMSPSRLAFCASSTLAGSEALRPSGKRDGRRGRGGGEGGKRTAPCRIMRIPPGFYFVKLPARFAG